MINQSKNNMEVKIMSETSLSLIAQFPKEKFTLLVPIETVAKISDIQSPVINSVSISTNLEDKEIYEQEKAKDAWTDRQNRQYPAQKAKYALTKKGLTKLAEAAGIKQVESQPVLPSTCQKCSEVNKMSGKIIPCGQCNNKDVKYKVTISVPQLTGENLYFVDHHEINVQTVTAGMSQKQKTEFMKHLTQICEAKALNGAIRTALQIKGTYSLEELKKPFIVAYLVPNLDNPDVKRVAIESMFNSTQKLFGSQGIVEPKVIEQHHEPTPLDEDYTDVYQEEVPSYKQEMPAAEAEDRTKDFFCDKCGKQISPKVWKYSYDNMGRPLCMDCQKGDNNGYR